MLKLNILTPKGMSLAQKIASHQFWCQCVHRCDLWARRRNQKKTNKKTGYSPRPPTSSDQNQILHVGRSPRGSSKFQVLWKSLKGFWRSSGAENRPSPLLWLVGYTTACTTV